MTIKILLWAITTLVISKTLWQIFALVRAWAEWRDTKAMDAIVENLHHEFNVADNVPF